MPAMNDIVDFKEKKLFFFTFGLGHFKPNTPEEIMQFPHKQNCLYEREVLEGWLYVISYDRWTPMDMGADAWALFERSNFHGNRYRAGYGSMESALPKRLTFMNQRLRDFS